jgi:hypothetical protein
MNKLLWRQGRGRMRRSTDGSAVTARSGFVTDRRAEFRPLTRFEADLKQSGPNILQRQTDVLLRLGEAPKGSAERDGCARGTVWLTSRNSVKIRPNHMGEAVPDERLCDTLDGCARRVECGAAAVRKQREERHGESPHDEEQNTPSETPRWD